MDTLTETLRAALARGRVAEDRDELLVYECDALTHYRSTPRAVVFPESTEEVAEVMRVLAREGVPLVPRGAGTGLSGGALAPPGGVVIELARMRRVLKVDAANRTARVEAGAVNAAVSRAAAPAGLHYAPDPSSQPTCTVGGNIAENAGGIHCLKYGTTTDHVLGARIVLAGGRVVELGGECEGGAAGYDLLGLFVGSEGTFGVVTEATLRLTPLPPAVRTVLADFAEIDDASRAVSAVIAAGLIPAALEMVDGATIRAVEQSVFAAGLPPDAGAALLVELDGLAAGLDEETERAEAILRAHGARTCRRAADEAERKKLWAARKGAFGAMGRLSPDLMLQDAVVPRSRLPEVLAETYRVGARHGLLVANVFHAGDGNLHPYICFDARKAGEVERVKEAGREIVEACVRAGGTITGEHGVGLDKRDYLPLVCSPDALDAMLRVRAAFDPEGLCNPGKVIPAPLGCGEGRAVARALAIGASNDAADGRPANNYSRPPSAPEETPRASAPPFNVTPRVPVAPRCFDAEAAYAALVGLLGAENVSGTPGGALRVEPGTAEEASAVMRLAAGEGWAVVPAGAGLWLDGGLPAGRAELFVGTRRLARLVEHEPADLVVTAEAGMTLGALDEELRRRGQWLPLDPPGGAGATLGGVVATGLSGAQGFGYGRPRAHLLGVRVALADGREARFGGRVVKNVAGYDIPKLLAGSYGTLALLLELTFKLRPRPAREATVVARSAEHGELFAAARALLDARLLPVAVELLSPAFAAGLGEGGRVPGGGAEAGCALLARFAGAAEAVEFQVARARELLDSHDGISAVEALEEDAALWEGVAVCGPREGARTVWRACVPPSELPSLLEEAGGGARGRDTHDLFWQAGAGDGRLRVFDRSARSTTETAAALTRLRAKALRAGGSLVIERAAAELVEGFDPWGVPESASALMRRVKGQLDPAGILSPGRFF